MSRRNRKLKETDLIEAGDLTESGVMVILEYLSTKNARGEKIIFFNTILGIGEVVNLFNEFIKSPLDRLFVYRNQVAGTVHRSIYLFEKHEGKFYFIILDSLPGWEKTHIEYHTSKLKNVIFLKNYDRIQTKGSHCKYYAFKILHLACLIPHMGEELLKNIKKSEKINDLTVQYYSYPAQFMHLATSPDLIEAYIRDYPNEAARILRNSKCGEPQNLRQWAYQKREEKYGVTTPYLVQDKHNLEHTIEQNNSIDRTKSKYLEIVRMFAKTKSLEDLDMIVKKYRVGLYEISQLSLPAESKYDQSFFKELLKKPSPDNEAPLLHESSVSGNCTIL